jgi:hypothetical protein
VSLLSTTLPSAREGRLAFRDIGKPTSLQHHLSALPWFLDLRQAKGLVPDRRR